MQRLPPALACRWIEQVNPGGTGKGSLEPTTVALEKWHFVSKQQSMEIQNILYTLLLSHGSIFLTTRPMSPRVVLVQPQLQVRPSEGQLHPSQPLRIPFVTSCALKLTDFPAVLRFHLCEMGLFLATSDHHSDTRLHCPGSRETPHQTVGAVDRRRRSETRCCIGWGDGRASAK